MRPFSSTSGRFDWAKILRPSWGELIYWAGWMCLDRFVGGFGWWEVFKFFCLGLFVGRVFALVNFWVNARWPNFFESRYWVLGQRAFWSVTFGAILVYWLIRGGGGEQLLAFRPDWQGALCVLAFGSILVVLWPFYRLIERCLPKS